MDTSMRSMFSKVVQRSAWVVAVAVIGVLSVAATAATRPKPVLTFCDGTCGTSFAVSTARDIAIRTSWKGLTSGQHHQKTVLMLPDGSIYQTFETDFKITGKQSTIESVLPVAGSWIQQRGLKGNWTVAIYLDGNLVEQRSLSFTD